MKVTIISDTHNQHEALGTLSGDVLVHCGDMFSFQDWNREHLHRLDSWFSHQDFDLILCTGGNHDFVLEQALRENSQPFKNAVYLQDQKYKHNGVVFYGAPWTPQLSGHAFYGDDHMLREKWSLIPKDTNVLITHTPPYSVLDKSSRGMTLGCKRLAKAVKNIKPNIHCFGHVHNSAGLVRNRHTVFVNASSVNSRLQVIHKPVVLEI